MSTPRKYRFTISWDGNTRVCDPDYSGSLVTKRQSEAVFYRTDYNGTLRLIRGEYDFFIAFDIEQRFDILIEYFEANGYPQSKFTGYFHKTDLQVSDDERYMEFKPIIDDEYTPIIENKSLKVNIPDVSETSVVEVRRTGILQVYFRETDVVTNITENQSWTTPVIKSTDDHSKLTGDYKFQNDYNFGYVPSVLGAGEDVSGLYREILAEEEYLNVINGYYLKINIDGRWAIFENASKPSNDWLYEAVDSPALIFGSPRVFGLGVVFRHKTEDSECRMFRIKPYTRMLCNVEEVQGTATEKIPNDDIIDDHSNMLRVAPVNVVNFVPESVFSVSNQGLGQVVDEAVNNAGQFFRKPVTGSEYYSLLQDQWTSYALWFIEDQPLRDLFLETEEFIKIPHSYNLVDVINGMLSAFGSGHSAQRNIDSSEFIFDASNPIRGGSREILIIPKSNILVGAYDQPATKAELTWDQLTQMMMLVYKLYYHLDNGRVKLEHISYYEKGKSYGSNVIGTDLTGTIAPGPNMPHSYGQNSYKYDKPNMPERLTFAWMDESTDHFNGHDIVMESTYVNKGEIKDNVVNQFTSDLDYVLYKQGDVSKEGFILVDAELIGGVYKPAIVDIKYNGDTKSVQNGHASFVYLHDKYHRHGLPAKKVTINDVSGDAISVKRNKIQEVNYPDTEFSEMELIKTGIGDGAIRSVSQDLNTGHLKIEIEHDTE